ncbi:MAG: PilZ domain-containing protein [Candidatus Omnitrophica bacterium]|nr:PilZ domain-containing protein [Candidatus Omnitrophota bacterium]
MPLNTRAKKRETVEALAEYAINESTEKTVKLNIPKSSIKSEAAEVVFVKANLLDISVIGCAIDSPYIIPPGVILDIKIDPTPFTNVAGGERKESVKVIGRVTSCVMKTASHYRLGVCFTKIEKEDVDLIDNFIRLSERRQAPRWDMTK